VRIALDTNILSAVLSGEPIAGPIVARLSEARQAGDVLVICGVVYVELLAYPNITRELRDDFLADTELIVELDLSRDVWELAGEAYLKYIGRRRSSGVAPPRRVPADFLIAAHAQTRADCLFTLDAGVPSFYPNLRILEIARRAG
jgi:predicted nucleic acid-binding protein